MHRAGRSRRRATILLLAQRASNATRLAQERAEEDAATAIVEHADGWAVELDGEIERARQRGRAALESLRVACEQISAAASAQAWLESAHADGRLDRPQRQMTVGTAAFGAEHA